MRAERKFGSFFVKIYCIREKRIYYLIKDRAFSSAGFRACDS